MSPSATKERLSRLEDPATEFPFYNGALSSISGGQRLFVIAMTIAGFLMLTLRIDWPGGIFGQLIPAVAMPAIPLAALDFACHDKQRAAMMEVNALARHWLNCAGVDTGNSPRTSRGGQQ